MKGLLSLFLSLTVFAGSATNLTGFSEALNALFNMSEIMKTDYIGEVSTETWDENTEFSLNDCVTLTKKDGEDFVILNITDTHFSDYDYRAFFSFGTSMTIKRLVNQVKPDLITITGDIVCTDSTVYAVKRITDLFDSFCIPWAPVFGNHDGEGNADLNYLADVMMSSEYCVMKKGDPEMGVGNYIINIAEESSGEITETLFMMDTHRTHLNEKQIKWFESCASAINKLTDNGTEITAFFHIPTVQYQYAYDEGWDADAKEWKTEYNADGKCNEKICCERDENGNPRENGFFAAAKNAGTKFIFCGHEHRNNFSVEYEGIRLTYTLKVGYTSGVHIGYHGGTIINVGESGINRITHRTLSYGFPVDIVDVTC